VIVASTDQHGATVIEKRIPFKLSSVALKLPAGDRQEPVEKLVQKVADSITEMTMATLRQSLPAAN
jgi:hypothetical protein